MTNNKTTLLVPAEGLSPLKRLNRFLRGPKYTNARYFIILDEHTYEHCLTPLIAEVGALAESEFVEVPVGEDCKEIAIAEQIWQTLIESGADRQSVIINLGGGCVSDLGGFVAANYKRGIRYINIPTTLVGMVDAAIGGKCGVNMCGAKNQIGAFAFPAITCIEPTFLESLPDEQLRAGTFEMLKMLLLTGEEIDWSKLSYQKLVNEKNIYKCASLKTSVVKTDPLDTGVRKMLNFGHTFGHAIESFETERGKTIAHGDAVGLGMICALYLSVQKLGYPETLYENYRGYLGRTLTLPHYTLQDCERLLWYIMQDKKNREGLILCVLLSADGSPIIDVVVEDNEVRDAFLSNF